MTKASGILPGDAGDYLQVCGSRNNRRNNGVKIRRTSNRESNRQRHSGAQSNAPRSFYDARSMGARNAKPVKQGDKRMLNFDPIQELQTNDDNALALYAQELSDEFMLENEELNDGEE